MCPLTTFVPVFRKSRPTSRMAVLRSRSARVPCFEHPQGKRLQGSTQSDRWSENLQGGHRSLAFPRRLCSHLRRRLFCSEGKYRMPPARVLKLDACGLQCPGPVLKLKQHMDNLKPGERLEVSATDADSRATPKPGAGRRATASFRRLPAREYIRL